MITLIPNLPELQYTAYFYSKNENMILPLWLPNDSTGQIISAQSGGNSPRPLVHDTLRRAINALGGTITGVLIDRYKDDLYYAYIRVKKNNVSYDIDSGLTDALCLALMTGVRIDVNKEILNEYGIKVTKELLEKALNS